MKIGRPPRNWTLKALASFSDIPWAIDRRWSSRVSRAAALSWPKHHS